MDLYRLNLNLLVALDILLLEQSVTYAAKKLFITQAAMSNNLQQLREIFKDELLIREKNHMVLTSYAKELQPKLNQVLQELQSIIVSGQRFEPETSERIFKIGMSDYIASLLLPKLIVILQRKAPKIKIYVISAYHLSNTEPFEKGYYDLGIGKEFELAPPVRTQVLFKDTVVCLLNRRHKLAKKSKITLKDYLINKHIAVQVHNQHFPRAVIEEALNKLGYRRDILISLPFILPIFKLIEESDTLIATVNKSMANLHTNVHRTVIKPLPFKIPVIEFSLAWHQQYDNDPGHQWLRQQILEIGSTMSS